MPRPDLLNLHVRRGYRAPFIGVTFSEHTLLTQLTTALRKAWLLRLGEEVTANPRRNGLLTLLDFLRDTPEKTLAELREDDRENAHTLNRDTVHDMWNHLFHNISSFLVNINCNTGQFLPPAHGTLDIRFPEEGDEGEMVKLAEFSNDTHFLILPTFVEPGIKVHITVGDEEGQAALRTDPESLVSGYTNGFAFDATEADWAFLGTDIYWVKANQKISVSVPRQADKAGRLAAVLVYGKYEDNFAKLNDAEHMRLHESLDDGGDGEVHEKLEQTRWGGTGRVPDERELCSEISSIQLWLKRNGNEMLKAEVEGGKLEAERKKANQQDEDAHTDEQSSSHHGAPSVLTVLSEK